MVEIQHLEWGNGGNSQSDFVMEFSICANLWQTSGKPQAKPQANLRQTSGKPWANLGQTLGKTSGKTLGKPWEILWEHSPNLSPDHF